MGYVAKRTKGEKSEMERLNAARADKTELEVKIKSGEYVDLKEVRAVWMEMVLRFKSRLELMPQAVAGQVSLEMDPGKNMILLRDTIDQALKELSRLTFEALDIRGEEIEEVVLEEEPIKKKKAKTPEPLDVASETKAKETKKIKEAISSVSKKKKVLAKKS